MVENNNPSTPAVQRTNNEPDRQVNTPLTQQQKDRQQQLQQEQRARDEANRREADRQRNV